MRLQNSMCYKNGICLFCSTSAASARALGCAGCSSPRPVGTRSRGIRSWGRWEEATGGPQNQGCCLQPSTLPPSLWVFATCGRSAAAAACLAQWVSFRMDKTSIPACLQPSPHGKSTDSVVHTPAGSDLCWKAAGLPSTGWQLPCSPLSCLALLPCTASTLKPCAFLGAFQGFKEFRGALQRGEYCPFSFRSITKHSRTADDNKKSASRSIKDRKTLPRVKKSLRVKE